MPDPPKRPTVRPRLYRGGGGARDDRAQEPPEPDWRRHVRDRLSSSVGLAPTREREIEEELVQHLHDRWRELVSGGTSRHEAERLALAELGDRHALARGLAPLRQAHTPPPLTPGATTGRWMGDLWHDVRGGMRAIRASGTGGALAIATLAVGFGAATALFSVVYAAILRPVPFAEPDRLVTVWLTRSATDANSRTRFSFGEFTALREQATSFEALASFTRADHVAIEIGDQAAAPVTGEFVSHEYWSVLRQRPLLGRLTTPADDDRLGGAVAVVSARLWRERADADAAIVGGVARINGVPLTIIGVLEDGFHGLSERADLWMPPSAAPRLTYAEYLTTPQHFITVAGRLRDDVALGAASRELSLIGPRVANGGQPDRTGAVWSATATLMNAERVLPAVRRTAWLLVATIACVLLVSVANVTSGLLAQALQRRRDVAVRRALGADAWRLARQALVESALLSGLAAGAGGFIAAAVIRLLQAAGPSGLPSPATGYVQLSSFSTPALESPVLAFHVAVALAAAALFAVVSAWHGRVASAADVVRDTGRTSSRQQLRTLHAVVAFEIAIAVVLVSGATLLVASARGLERQRDGFDGTGVLTVRVAPPASRYRPEEGPRILGALLASVQRAPGVALAAINRCVPLDPGCARAAVYVPDRPEGVTVERHYISADYFRVLGMRVLAGRAISETDRAGAAPVVVVSETAARTFWPGRTAIGQRVWFSNPPAFADPTRPLEVVGVVADVKYGTIDDPVLPDFYTSFHQFAYPDSMMLVKAAPGPSSGLLASLAAAIADVDRGLSVSDPMSLEDRVVSAWATPRFHAAAVLAFATLALMLAALGVYGIATVAVSRRSREMGIRIAVGAEPQSIARLVLREHLVLGFVGGAIGLAVAYAAGTLLKALLYGVAATDPRGAAVAVVALISAVVAGAILPARRAARVNPTDLLRRE